MIALDILKNWPGIRNSSVEDVISSPAFAMPVNWPEPGAVLSFQGIRPIPVFAVTIRFANEEQVLGLPSLELFPTLKALSSSMPDLPDELVLAALETDAGGLFALLEDCTQRQLQVLGLARTDDLRFDTARTVTISSKNGAPALSFLLSLSPALLKQFHNLAFLNLAHPDIAGRELPATVEIASFQLTKDELDNLAPGDAILLPECEPNAPAWKCLIQIGNLFSVLGQYKNGKLLLSSSPNLYQTENSGLHIVFQETIHVTLLELATLTAKNGTIEKDFQPTALQLLQGNELLASGQLEALGEHNAMAIQYAKEPQL